MSRFCNHTHTHIYIYIYIYIYIFQGLHSRVFPRNQDALNTQMSSILLNYRERQDSPINEHHCRIYAISDGKYN